MIGVKVGTLPASSFTQYNSQYSAFIPVSGAVLNIGGELFSIPSPLQTAMLIQKTGSAYDKSILNTKENMNQYATDFSKALNLGIYGADLGYVNMYSKTQDAISYLAAVKKLSDDVFKSKH